MLWYRQDPGAVRTALASGERPDLATTTACGPLDELIALHDELGIFALLDEAEVGRERAGRQMRYTSASHGALGPSTEEDCRRVSADSPQYPGQLRA